jgi:hypothetical protein
MLQRLGNVIYWTASGAAVLTASVGVYVAWMTAAENAERHLGRPYEPIGFMVVGFAIAGLIWLAGKAARYVLAG